MTRRSYGPAPEGVTTWVTRALALAALAGIIGVGHSMVVPVAVSLEDVLDPPAVALPAVDPNGLEGPGGDPIADGADGETGPDGPVGPESKVNEGTGPVPQPSSPQAQVRSFELDLDASFEKWNEGAVFFDARRDAEFEQSRVAGAFYMPSSRVFDSVDTLDPLIGEQVVIYCVGGDCDASKNTMIKLITVGFDRGDVFVMTASFDDWVAAGYPVEEGAP
ncbi:MAG: rhodanese-like domain-containing protein [Planctomycetota bacterium]